MDICGSICLVSFYIRVILYHCIPNIVRRPIKLCSNLSLNIPSVPTYQIKDMYRNSNCRYLDFLAQFFRSSVLQTFNKRCLDGQYNSIQKSFDQFVTSDCCGSIGPCWHKSFIYCGPAGQVSSASVRRVIMAAILVIFIFGQYMHMATGDIDILDIWFLC